MKKFVWDWYWLSRSNQRACFVRSDRPAFTFLREGYTAKIANELCKYLNSRS